MIGKVHDGAAAMHDVRRSRNEGQKMTSPPICSFIDQHDKITYHGVSNAVAT